MSSMIQCPECEETFTETERVRFCNHLTSVHQIDYTLAYAMATNPRNPYRKKENHHFHGGKGRLAVTHLDRFSLCGENRAALIQSWHDLRHWGINILTGEACGYSGRYLADLDEKGVEIVTEFLGGNVTFTPKSQWNAGVASIMLSRNMIADLCVFCLIHDGWSIVIARADGIIMGYQEPEWDEIRDRYLAAYPGTQVYTNRGTAGTRNRHAWTGRIQ